MIYYLIIAGLVSTATGASNVKAFFPPSKSMVFPRLRLESTLPNLREMTFCSWVNAHYLNGSFLAPIVSYATSRMNNEFLILLFNRNREVAVRVYRGSAEANIDCKSSCQLGSWCHVCVSWFGPSGRTITYVNGEKCKEVSLKYNEPYVPSGGVLVIGQEQDGLDSKFDVNQAWVGDIADVHLWDEVLSWEQIKEAGTCRSKRREGTVVSWLKTPMAAVDGVVLSATQLCMP